MIANNINNNLTNDLCKYLEENNNRWLVGIHRPKIYIK